LSRYSLYTFHFFAFFSRDIGKKKISWILHLCELLFAHYSLEISNFGPTQYFNFWNIQIFKFLSQKTFLFAIRVYLFSTVIRPEFVLRSLKGDIEGGLKIIQILVTSFMDDPLVNLQSKARTALFRVSIISVIWGHCHKIASLARVASCRKIRKS
jgi:hypothetical protein